MHHLLQNLSKALTDLHLVLPNNFSRIHIFGQISWINTRQRLNGDHAYGINITTELGLTLCLLTRHIARRTNTHRHIGQALSIGLQNTDILYCTEVDQHNLAIGLTPQ